MNIFRKKKEKKYEPVTKPTAKAESAEPFFREVNIEFLIHELKDPIAVVETGLRTLLERRDKYGELTQKQEKTLQRTLRNSQKARGMLSNLLEIGRSQSGCFTACRFYPAEVAYRAMSEALETMAWKAYEEFCRYENKSEAIAFLAKSGIFLEIPTDASEIEMTQDETKFCQIVGNLVKNALHHRRDRLQIRMAGEGDCFTVEVTDDGPGIDVEHHQMIFERYFRIDECTITPRSGHGLGLAGARILARCMGGDIDIRSEKDEGSTFRLKMPLEMGSKFP